MWELAFVGAGLPAIAADQLAHLAQTHRYRRQASSHIWIAVCLEVLSNRHHAQ